MVTRFKLKNYDFTEKAEVFKSTDERGYTQILNMLFVREKRKQHKNTKTQKHKNTTKGLSTTAVRLTRHSGMFLVSRNPVS
jgi:hypothetical protein